MAVPAELLPLTIFSCTSLSQVIQPSGFFLQHVCREAEQIRFLPPKAHGIKHLGLAKIDAQLPWKTEMSVLDGPRPVPAVAQQGVFLIT